MNPLVLQVLIVTTTPKSGPPGVRAFVDASEYRLRELGEEFVQSKPEEALRVSYEVVPAEGVPTLADHVGH